MSLPYKSKKLIEVKVLFSNIESSPCTVNALSDDKLLLSKLVNQLLSTFKVARDLRSLLEIL